MSLSDAFMRGFARAAAKSPIHCPAVIYQAEPNGEGIAFDQGQMVFREVQRTFGFRDLPSENALGIWQGEYQGEGEAGGVTLTVLTEALLDHGNLIEMKGTLYHVMAVKAGDAAGVSVKVLGKAVQPPLPRLLAPGEAWPPLGL